MFLPEIAQQFHFAIGKVVLRASDHDRLQFGWNGADIEKVQFLKPNIFVLDKRLQDRDGTGGRGLRWHCHRSRIRQWRFFVAEDVTERVLLALDQIHHRAGDDLLALERGHARPFAQHLIARIDLGHFRGFHRLVATLVIEHEQTLVAHHFVFLEHFLGPRKVAFGIDVLDVDLSLGCVLILSQQALHVRCDRRVREENGDSHLAFDRIEKALGLI